MTGVNKTEPTNKVAGHFSCSVGINPMSQYRLSHLLSSIFSPFFRYCAFQQELHSITLPTLRLAWHMCMHNLQQWIKLVLLAAKENWKWHKNILLRTIFLAATLHNSEFWDLSPSKTNLVKGKTHLYLVRSSLGSHKTWNWKTKERIVLLSIVERRKLSGVSRSTDGEEAFLSKAGVQLGPNKKCWKQFLSSFRSLSRVAVSRCYCATFCMKKRERK